MGDVVVSGIKTTRCMFPITIKMQITINYNPLWYLKNCILITCKAYSWDMCQSMYIDTLSENSRPNLCELIPVRMHTHMCTHARAHAYTCMFAHTRTCMHTHTYMHAHTHVHACTHTTHNAHTHTRAHTHTQCTHTHTYIHRHENKMAGDRTQPYM